MTVGCDQFFKKMLLLVEVFFDEVDPGTIPITRFLGYDREETTHHKQARNKDS